MEGAILSDEMIHSFREHLINEEKSPATVEKYVRDARTLMTFCGGKPLSKVLLIAFKQQLLSDGYAIRSVNVSIASVNCLLKLLGLESMRLKSLKIQRQVFCPEDRELTQGEFERLCRTAEAQHNQRLSLLLQAICGTGIRVSELPFITVEAVRQGKAVVSLKGKTRVVFIVRSLQRKLMQYVNTAKIRTGPIFVTRSGRPMNRTSVWKEMKSLCAAARVNPCKVFPHNLRHLFARVFYGVEKDIVKLADILGHSSIDTTRIYVVSTGTEHRKRMERMRLIQ